jgi:transposase
MTKKRKEPQMQKKNKRLNFNNQQFYIGIDVHKKQWTITIRNNKIKLKTFTMNPSVEELTKHMKWNYPGGQYHSVYEAGYSGYWIHRRLEEMGFKNKIAAPTEIPTSSKEKTNKGDAVDSRKLARELENGSIEGIYIPKKLEEEFRSIVRQRYQLVRSQTRIKNQIKGYLNFYGHKLSKNTEVRYWSANFLNKIKTLEFAYPMGKRQLLIYISQLEKYRELMSQITKEIRNYMTEYGMDKKARLLCTVPGVGFTTAAVLLSELIDINRFRDINSLNSYCGLIPSVRGSDEKEKVLGIKFNHNKYIRQLLIESSWIAIRKDPALTEAYGRYKRTMAAQKAIIKVARKLLSRIRYVWKNEKEYVCAVVN